MVARRYAHRVCHDARGPTRPRVSEPPRWSHPRNCGDARNSHGGAVGAGRDTPRLCCGGWRIHARTLDDRRGRTEAKAADAIDGPCERVADLAAGGREAERLRRRRIRSALVQAETVRPEAQVPGDHEHSRRPEHGPLDPAGAVLAAVPHSARLRDDLPEPTREWGLRAGVRRGDPAGAGARTISRTCSSRTTT